MKIEEMENILAKKATGEATSSELAILDQWRRQSSENQAVYNEYSILWDMSANYEPENFNPNFESALSAHLSVLEEETVLQEPKETVVRSITDKVSTPIFSIKRFSSIAAIFVLGIAAIFLLKNNTTTITADNGVRFAALEDGSKIWLEQGSSIEYSNGFGVDHRNVTLNGKAFFDVNRNEDLPFSIKENDINVTVLGTSFTVDGNNDVVYVTTGKVSVENQTENVVITKNQVARLANNKFDTSETAANTAMWRNTSLAFEDSPISQVIADINMFHNNKVVLDGTSISDDCTFTSGGLSTESLENIIEILKKSFDLQVSTTDSGKIKLLITDCN